MTHSPPSSGALLDTLPQQVAEEGQGVVQLHLLVVEGQREGQGAQEVTSQPQAQHAPKGQTQAYAVISGAPSRKTDFRTHHHRMNDDHQHYYISDCFMFK